MEYFKVLIVLLSLVILCESNVLPLSMIPNEKRFQMRGFEIRDNGDSVALLGSVAAYGKFFLDVTLGTPAQNLKLIPDTGSSDIIVYGSTCVSSICKEGASYSYLNSSTDNPVACRTSGYVCTSCDQFDGANTCIFKNRYGVNPIVEADGNILTDYFGVGDYSNVPVDFGYITNLTSTFFDLSPAQGLWGLAYPGLSFHSSTSFDSLVATENIPNMFSMCLQDNSAVMTIGVNYGENSQFSWTPITQQLYYSIYVNDMRINGSSLNLAASQYNTPAIVDSGTTLLYLPQSVYSALIAEFKKMKLAGVYGQNSGQTIFDGYCFELTQAQLNSYPNISFYVNGISTPLNVIPNTYLVPTQINGNTYRCSGIDNSGNSGVLIMGDVFMGNFHVAFDRANARVGFADPSTCPTSSGSLDITTLKIASVTSGVQSITSGQHSVTSGVQSITSAAITSGVQSITSGQHSVTSGVQLITSAAITSGVQSITSGQHSVTSGNEFKTSSRLTSGIVSLTTKSITTSSTSAQCNVGSMRCVGTRNYQTCVYTRSSGGYVGGWGSTQSCGAGTHCVQHRSTSDTYISCSRTD